jgi:hypothetical protein
VAGRSTGVDRPGHERGGPSPRPGTPNVPPTFFPDRGGRDVFGCAVIHSDRMVMRDGSHNRVIRVLAG